ncbi:hypothetical protein G9A89_018547 [Geosiphon pyriformis]|nr:hypothetical protein G9A89_018547 [Geosiphon pyriformis]
MNKFNGVQVFTSGLNSGYLGSGVAIIIDISLAKHVCKDSEVPGWLISLKLLFKNKLSVLILGLYAGASLVAQFSQAGNINSMIAKAINEFSFVILGGDFNEDNSYKCVNFKKCLDFDLVNSLSKCSYVKMLTWANSCGVAKMIDFLFIFSNLVNTAVFMSVDLGGLLDTWLNSLCKQANRDYWKFNFKNEFVTAIRFSDLNEMWDVVCKIIVLLVNEVFKKRWFKGFDNVFTRESSRYHKLELLVSKIVKTSHKKNVVNFNSLMKCWASLNNVKASVIQDVMDSGAGSGCICSAFCGARKAYHTSKLVESLRAKKTTIRAAIDKRMESFEINKSHTIRSVLKCPFCKVVFDYLVVDDELILELDLVKFKVDIIMESWTRKHRMVDDISGDWCYQYQPLKYVFNEVFSDVMCLIEFDELFKVIFSLSDGKAAGLLGILNELWKHCNKAVLDMLLMLLNFCLFGEFSVLTNTRPIALIKMTCKILSKILSDRIFLVCSTFDILRKDNFLVLKGTITQSPIFAIGSVIEDALEKNREFWMVLQNMKKAYNSVGWEHLKKSLIRIKMCNKFIHFFSGIYKDCTNCVMTDFGLTDDYWGEIFFYLLWHIFYDPLLCEVKHQKSVCGYRLNSYFVSKNGSAKFQAEFSFFFAAGTFFDNTIWVVVIFINSRVDNFSLSINGLPISIAKKSELYRYLGVFLSTKGLSKPSLAKANSDICFFTNLVLLKLKSGLPLNFLSDTIHNSFFYGLKSFFQVQSESKVASLVSFANSGSVVGHLFSYSFPVCIYVSTSNNFLADMVRVLFDCNLSLVLMSAVLDELKFFRFLLSLRQHGIAFVDQLCDHHGAVFNWYTFKCWKRLDPRGPVLKWFKLSIVFLNSVSFSSALFLVLYGVGLLNIFESSNFVSVCDHLSQASTSSLSVYMNRSFNNLGTASCRAGTAAYFENIGLGLEISVLGLMSSILVKLQAIALALECVLLSSSVQLFLDSQSALDVCKSKLSYSGISENECADAFAGAAFFSDWYLSSRLDEHFLIADGSIVSDNFRHFVGSGSKFLAGSLLLKVDCFTSKPLANACTYFMKALHYWLLVAVWKCLYNRLYPSVLCLYCGKVEVSNHVFSCKLLLSYISDFSVFTALYKGFVFDGWFCEAVSIFYDFKIASLEIVKFVHSLGLAFKIGV